MMIYCKSTDTEIKFDNSDFHTLIIENKPLLRNITYSFFSERPEEYFVFSHNCEPFEFFKRGIYIPSAVNLDLNNKKILSKINCCLEHLLTDELYTEFYEIKSKLLMLAGRLLQKSEFNVDFDCDVSPKDIVKLLGTELSRGDDDFAEAFIRYIQLAKEYLGVSLIVISNLHSFFGKEELDLIYKTLLLTEVRVLCIEGIQPNNASQYEKIHIVDNELCEI